MIELFSYGLIFRMLCGALTNKGKPCKRRVREGTKCQYHSRPTCCVCLDHISVKRHVKTPCCHEFHFECLKEWFAHSTHCPLCRADLGTLALEGILNQGVCALFPINTIRDLIINENTFRPCMDVVEGRVWDMTDLSAALPLFKVSEGVFVDSFTRAHATSTRGALLELRRRNASCMSEHVMQLYSTENPLNGCIREHWEISTRWGGEVMLEFCPNYPFKWDIILANMFAFLLLHKQLYPVNKYMYQHMIVAAVHNILCNFSEVSSDGLWRRVRSYFPNSENEEKLACRIRTILDETIPSSLLQI